ncbi:hypothetical protein ACE1CD_15365 [Aerosakkonema sp. BLCC-F183]|uniref:hypothetical protein n=1 Tax=Aerosakkonema sp. BLCC-F183 TaxID=3342834 RepID=UPI0035B9912F
MQTQTQVSAADLSELEFMIQQETLVRQERSHLIRGHVAKVESAKLWADKQEVTVERRQTQLDTEKTKLETDKQRLTQAQDTLKAETAMTQLNRLGHVKKLAKKAYGISGDLNILRQAQGAIAGAGSIAGALSAGKKS